MSHFHGQTRRMLLIKDSSWALEILILFIHKLQIYQPLWSHCVRHHRTSGHWNHNREFLFPVEKDMELSID